jgi:hypothetical protein
MSGISTWMLVASVAAAVLLVGCSSQPDIYRAEASGYGKSLQFEMAACHGDYAVTLSEGSEEVRVAITDQRRLTPFSGRDDCADHVGPLLLSQPLGDRRLVDGNHGVDIPVTYWPWNQTLYSDAEYLAALEAAALCVEALESEATVTVTTAEDGYPFLDVELPDLADGQSGFDPSVGCIEQHVDPLRH